MFLLDTSIVSELRRNRPHGGVVAWLRRHSAAALYLSAMSVAEIQQGIELTRKQDPIRAREIERWLEQSLLPSSQILSMDVAVCRAWARLMHGRSGTLAEDAFIAATAQVHGLTVATRNVRDFHALGVTVLNPFEYR